MKHSTSLWKGAAVTFSRHGNPASVLRAAQEAPAFSGTVEVKMTAAAICPEDANAVRGARLSATEKKLPFPRLGGSLGTGTLASGETVVFVGGHQGTWAPSVKAEAGDVESVSEKIPAEVRAVLAGSPSAASALYETLGLSDGQVLIQNNGSSLFGRTLAKLAARDGVKVVSVIRDRPDHADIVPQLKDEGAFAVVTENYTRAPEFRRLLSDLPAASVAVDGAAGASGTEIARTLGPAGRLVVYGAASGKPVTLPSSLLTSRGISVSGFEFASLPRDARVKALRTVEKMVLDGDLLLPVESHPFSEFSEALERHLDPWRNRAVVLDIAK